MRKVIFIDNQNRRFESEVHTFMNLLNKQYFSTQDDIVFRLWPKENIQVVELPHPQELGKVLIFETTKVNYAPAHNIFSLMWAKSFYELGYSVYLLDIAHKISGNLQQILEEINPDLIFDTHNYVANQEDLINMGFIPKANFLKLGCPIVLLIGELPLWTNGSLVSLKTLEMIKQYNALFTVLCHEKNWCYFFKKFDIKNVHFLPHFAPMEFSYPTDNLPKAYPISFVGNFLSPTHSLEDNLLALVNRHLSLKKQDFSYNFISAVMEEVFKEGDNKRWDKLSQICNHIGYQYENMRYFILSTLVNHYPLVLFGERIPEEFKTQPNVVYKGPAHWTWLPIIFGMTAINLNIHRIVFDTSTQERTFMLIFSKAFFLADYKEIFKELFPKFYKEFTFRNIGELVEKVDYYLRHESERREIAEALYTEVKNKHTMKHRAKVVLELLGKRYL